MREGSGIERKKAAGLIIPRMNGTDIEKDFDRYRRLVEAGIGGFILFGGRLDSVRAGISELRSIANRPLLILSDLEQGLGQQVDGGTMLPPAMAMGEALDRDDPDDIGLFVDALSLVARETRDAGIDGILAPVADIHTNPDNPIICTRAYGSAPDRVSAFVQKFIEKIQSAGIMTCAKHFPGHGDTDRDSHLELPALRLPIERIQATELAPFRAAVGVDVSMVMTGHLLVESVDPEKPATLSSRLIHGLLRKEIDFGGIVITDAMNMAGVRSGGGEAPACVEALLAGCDLILHPDDPEAAASAIAERWNETGARVEEAAARVSEAWEKIRRDGRFPAPPGRSTGEIVEKLTKKSIRITGGNPGLIGREILILVEEDKAGEGGILAGRLRQSLPGIEILRANEIQGNVIEHRIGGRPVVAAVFSRVAAWKGRAGLPDERRSFLERAFRSSSRATAIAFGCPSLLSGLRADTEIRAWWSGAPAQEAVAEILSGDSA